MVSLHRSLVWLFTLTLKLSDTDIVRSPFNKPKSLLSNNFSSIVQKKNKVYMKMCLLKCFIFGNSVWCSKRLYILQGPKNQYSAVYLFSYKRLCWCTKWLQNCRLLQTLSIWLFWQRELEILSTLNNTWKN